MQKSISPPSTHRTVLQTSQQPSTSKLAKYQVPRYPEEVVLRRQSSHTKPMLQRSSITHTQQQQSQQQQQQLSTDKNDNDNNVNGM